jgi:WD40 repeat protein
VLSAGGRDWALDAAFSPDATKIAIGNRSTGLAMWDAVSGEWIHPRGNDDLTTYDVAFSPDGEHVATASTDRWQQRTFNVEVWSVTTGEASTVAHPDPDRSWYWPKVAYADGRHGVLFIFDRDQVYRWDGQPGHDVEPILAKVVEWPDWIDSGAVTPDGDTVLLALADRVVAVDVETGRTIWPTAGHDERQATATSIVVDDVGARAALIRDDWAVDIVDPSSGEELGTISRERQGVRPTAVAFGGSDVLIVGAVDGSTGSWRLGGRGQPPRILSTARLHGDYVNSVQFGPDGEQVLSAGDDGRVLLWNDEHFEIDELIHVAEDRLAAFEDGDGS